MSEDAVTPDRPFRQRPRADAECDYCGRLGLLVARNVEKGAGQSERGSRLRDREDEKVSALRFANTSGTSADRISRYLKAWEKEGGRR